MRNSGVIIGGVVVVVIVVLFLLAPIVPYTFSSSNFGAYSGNVSAQVSPSFYLLGCGVVFNPTQSGSAPGVTVSHQIYAGGEWKCR
jgi:hypothetical protein